MVDQDHTISLYKSKSVPILSSNASCKQAIDICCRWSSIFIWLSEIDLRSNALSIPVIDLKYHGEYVLILDKSVTNFSNLSARSSSALFLRYPHAELNLQKSWSASFKDHVGANSPPDSLKSSSLGSFQK